MTLVTEIPNPPETIDVETCMYEAFTDHFQKILDYEFFHSSNHYYPNCWEILGETPCTFERIRDEAAVVKTYALGLRLDVWSYTNPAQESQMLFEGFIKRFMSMLREEIGANKKILIRKPPQITINKLSAVISTRLAICPDNWTKRKYRKHCKQRDKIFALERSLSKKLDRV